jgi:hypothetical protein
MARSENGKSHNSEDMTTENILRITEELVRQVDRSKRMIVIMIIAIIIAIPVSWHVAPLLTGSPDSFRLVGYITIAVAVLFLALGVRQWLILSKWTSRYKVYKEMQKRIDEKLDFEKVSDE